MHSEPHAAGASAASSGLTSKRPISSKRPQAPSLAFDRLPELGIGIRVKLIGLMVAMTIVIVLPLATYFPARELEELRAASRDRAEVYAGLVSHQLRSAVAFEDRETAREVLDAVAKDPLLSGLSVYTSDGRVLHGKGVLSDLSQRLGKRPVDQAASYALPGRIAAVAPVRSLEGARGTVVLELSTSSSKLMQQRLMLAALALGAAALLGGAGLAWLIARSLARRIEVIADGASAMSRGELEHVIDVSGPNDELGLLSYGFNAMSRKVSELVSHIQETAREESARLERLVSQRTEQLNTKNRDLRLVLDNVEQGFITVDREARVVGEYSRAIESWLGERQTGEVLWSSLTPGKPKDEASFAVGWEQLTDGSLPFEICLDQLPRRLQLGGRHLNVEYRPLGGEGFERLLVVISDVTAVVACEASEQEGRDLVNLTKRLLKDRDGFLEFLDESRRLLGRIRQNSADGASLKRDLHTLKGNTAIYGLQTVSAACHALEDALESGMTAAALDRGELLRHWERSLATVELLLGEHSDSKLQIDEKQYRALLDAIGRGASKRELEVMLKAWRLEPLRERLDRVAEQLVGVAARLGKGDVGVQIATADLYLGREELSEFWTAFTHVVRNAADHGLLEEGERTRAAAQGGVDFGLRAGIDRDELFVELSDRGPGIDWECIRARATERGIPHTTQAELEEALFADGVSARSEVTELSGRGVGLSAVRAACHKQRGTVHVTTGQGKGTSFRFSFPVSQFQSLVQLEAAAR